MTHAIASASAPIISRTSARSARESNVEVAGHGPDLRTVAGGLRFDGGGVMGDVHIPLAIVMPAYEAVPDGEGSGPVWSSSPM